MRKYLFALTFGLIAAGSWAYESNYIGTDTEAKRQADKIIVLNGDAIAHGEGSVLLWQDGSNDGVAVTTASYAAASTLVAGVVPMGYTLPASGYGFLQVSGYHSAVKVTSTTALGSMLVTADTPEKAHVNGSANHSNIIGKCFEATTTSTTVKVLLMLK